MDTTTIITAIIGAITTITSTYITVRIKDKTNSGLAEEVTRLKKNGFISPILSPKEYGITIVTPVDYENLDSAFSVNGTYTSLPEGQHIWVASFEMIKDHEGHIKRCYWPQEKVTADNGKWYGKVNDIGGKPGETKEFVVLIVGREGQRLFKYFKEAGKINDKYPAINELTTDIAECAFGKIKRK